MPSTALPDSSVLVLNDSSHSSAFSVEQAMLSAYGTVSAAYFDGKNDAKHCLYQYCSLFLGVFYG